MIEEIDVLESKEKSALSKFCYQFTKRSFDIVCSLLGCLVLLPIALVVKVMYMISGDFNSIFYTQKRIGKDGKEFNFYKFRTMVPNADEVLKKLLKQKKYKKQWESHHKIDKDPRITKIGKILRKTSLDELPQLINVLKSDMSLIGPRPLVPGELDEHKGNHKIYESVKPGITGWWASHGRSALTYQERLKLEYYYVQNQSLMLDIKCMFATVMAVLKKTGAK